MVLINAYILDNESLIKIWGGGSIYLKHYVLLTNNIKKNYVYAFH